MPNKFLLAIGLLASAAVSAADLSGSSESTIGGFAITATDHALVSNRRNPSDPNTPAANLLIHEDFIRAEYDVYSSTLQFTNQIPFSPGMEAMKKPFNFEKASLNAEWSQWDLKLGDSHPEIGKGIALSLYRDDVFGIDNTLQGGFVRYHPRGFEASAMGGRLNALRAPVALNPLPNPLLRRDMLVGAATAKVNVTEQGKLGVHGVVAYEQPLNSPDYDRKWSTVGATFQQDAILDGVDLYLEGNLISSQYLFGQASIDAPAGRGNYGSITYSPDSWRFKLEAKDYANNSFDFRRAPTLEEDFVETTNNTDVSATRFSIERKLADNRSSVTESSLVGYDTAQDRVFYHEVVGFKLRGQAPSKLDLEVKTGYRWMPERNHLVHGSVIAKIRTGKGQSVELTANKLKWRQKLNVIPIDDDRNIFGAGYNFNERLYAGLGYEYVPSNTADLGNHFFNVNGSYKTGDLTAKAFLGQTSGGTVCSGGVCRQVPPFTGASLETIYTF
jgi:hypothetical protein